MLLLVHSSSVTSFLYTFPFCCPRSITLGVSKIVHLPSGCTPAPQVMVTTAERSPCCGSMATSRSCVWTSWFRTYCSCIRNNYSGGRPSLTKWPLSLSLLAPLLVCFVLFWFDLFYFFCFVSLCFVFFCFVFVLFCFFPLCFACLV